MPWVVDTCVLLDIAVNDPVFGERSSAIINRFKSPDGCVVCPVTVVELAPQLDGDFAQVASFLKGCGIKAAGPWLDTDTAAAFRAWYLQVQTRRAGLTNRRPIADVLIGAYADQRTGLITRNPADFSKLFPRLQIIEP